MTPEKIDAAAKVLNTIVTRYTPDDPMGLKQLHRMFDMQRAIRTIQRPKAWEKTKTEARGKFERAFAKLSPENRQWILDEAVRAGCSEVFPA
jgi:hypothetical protein